VPRTGFGAGPIPLFSGLIAKSNSAFERVVHIMKGILIVLVLLAVGGFFLVKYGGIGSFDPTEQGKQAKAAIKTAMTWKQVIDEIGEPGNFSMIIRKIEEIDGEKFELFEPTVESRFKKDRFIKRFDDGEYEWGFLFLYQFSPTVAFQVKFGGDGLVSAVTDSRTIGDLWDLAGGGPGE
jgi:hypothetical protein